MRISHVIKTDQCWSAPLHILSCLPISCLPPSRRQANVQRPHILLRRT